MSMVVLSGNDGTHLTEPVYACAFMIERLMATDPVLEQPARAVAAGKAVLWGIGKFSA